MGVREGEMELFCQGRMAPGDGVWVAANRKVLASLSLGRATPVV